MSKAIVIGGGIIGLSSALYLKRIGYTVTVLDKGDFLDNCSYGNCGYICPSHFIPLATPGIVKQGLKWMWNASSPFYVQPRLDWNLIDWGLKFMRAATKKHVATSAVPLRDIALLSQQEYAAWAATPQLQFAYEHKGLLEIFQTPAAAEHAKHTVEQAHALALNSTRLLSAEELQALEPHTKINALGAIYFECDAHCYPNKLMQQLLELLRKEAVELIPYQEVTGFEKNNRRINEILVSNNRTGESVRYTADEVILATGSWSRQLAAWMNLRLPLMPGRGYSLTLENSPYRVNYPAVLVEGRAAITPMDGNKIRFGGTMEITSHQTPPRPNRVKGILDAVKRYYPEFDIAMPGMEKVWYGYRPCSADGLPYIGKSEKWKNLTIATGHSMLGLSLGAGTGKLVSEIVSGATPSMNIAPFAVERFG